MDKQKNIVFYDGICNLCNWFVRFIKKRDHNNSFQYITLQSEEAKRLLRSGSHQNIGLQTVLYVEDGNKVYSKSTAALKIIKHFKFPYTIFYYLSIIIPAFFRDTIYDFVAKNRYKWFGKNEKCEV